MTRLDGRIKELIAIGASVTANCQPCLEYHVSAALAQGADPVEIKESIAVGKLVRKGAADKFDKTAAGLALAPSASDNTRDKECGYGQ